MKQKATAKSFMAGRLVYVLIFVIGAVAFFYPLITNLISSQTQTQVISNYEQEMEALDQAEKELLLQQANEYNEFVSSLEGNVTDDITEAEKATTGIEYESVLGAANEDNIIGSVSVPKIDVEIPIYHGTSDEVLDLGAGHLERSSLPIGGVDTHSVLVAHRGLPTARLFRDLGMLEKGDVFFVSVAGKTLAYEVESMVSVLPNEVESLRVQDGKDLCTLVTCDPYMINSHRMLVTGHRIDYVPGDDASEIEGHISFFEKYREYFIIVGIFSALLLITWLIKRRTRMHKKQVHGSLDA